MTKGTHLLRSALLALLALAVISGGSLAAGDLFDDDYSDCPHKTRLRDGQISDLSVNRDSDDEDHVNVSWAATDPATWGLGANAYSTSLVVILDDGSSSTETLSLGSRKTTFEGVETGTEVTVQMAIVVDTADGKFLISDILEQSISQSISEPTFMADVSRVRTPVQAGTDGTVGTPNVGVAGFGLGSDDIDEVPEATGGVMYYVGYNENFANYKEATYSIASRPSTARLRIGLRHTDANWDSDDVDFDAYIVRITDEDGDVVSEGDDVASVSSSYSNNNVRFVFGSWGDATTANNLLANEAFSNVRINDDGAIQPSIQVGGLTVDVGGTAISIAVGGAIPDTVTHAPAVDATGVSAEEMSYVRPAPKVIAATPAPAGTLFAPLPDEHRDFPIDVLASDETYTFTAWAINDDSEVISPVSSLKVRPIDETITLGAALTDYVGTNGDPTTADVGDTIVVTEFTVLK